LPDVALFVYFQCLNLMSGILIFVKQGACSFLIHWNAGMRKKFVACLMCLLYLLPAETLFAEGSKELSSNGGYRAFLVSSTVPNLSYPFPTLGTMKVYAKVGESIYLGSSAQGFGAGTINLRAPDGSTYSSGSSTTIGVIANRSQELAGPLPNAGGYTPFIKTVLPGQEGIWEIDFIPQNNGTGTGANPVPILANANWGQPSGEVISAFDVSVRNVTNSAFIPGRLYTNIFSGILGTFDVGFNGVFRILTKDGYQYTLDNNGQAGNGFSFFANNKGFRATGGAASYKSVDVLVNPDIQDPRAIDTPTDITHKIFFNTPASDLPASANTPGGGATWLLSVPVTPTVTGSTFTGAEGTAGKGGTNPLGGIIGFNANQNGNYLISIDVNNNGIFTDAIDRKLNGTATVGANQVQWDGLDGQGNKVPATGSNQLTLNIRIVLFGGEVHFPFFDVERNINGIILTRVNGSSSPDNTVYWDDTPITIITGTPSNPLTNLTGINSQVNGHKWGTAGAGPVDFGDENGLDTWGYISSSPLISSLTFQLQEADLEVVSINSAQDCAGKQIIYTVPVKNNGPNAVSGTKFRFSFPPEMSSVSVSSLQTSGVSTLTSGAVSAGNYDAVLDMNNGAIRTFTISGNVSLPSGGILNVTASMMRTPDLTDPDATNPDAAPPTDPIAECNSSPSGTGCNNVKIQATSFFAAPNAGPDQTVKQNVTVTMAATGTGSWTQSGSLPSAAVITVPASASTTITGLNTIGKYTFIWKNPNGCADTVAITVISSAPPETVIPNIFTPNGDGKNDVFEISKIENYPGSQLMVFNRWGNEVYKSENYLNTWNGSNLADGTYFYVLNRRENTGNITVIKGWVYLKR
jgi:gliding motility-associated-like protein/uncharacterized repeat protein (TIGR01451 family)